MIFVGEDIVKLTGKVRPSAQRRALDKMGVRYLVRPDGRPVVLDGGQHAKQHEPDFDVLGAA